MSSEIFHYIPRKNFSMLEKDVFPRLIKQGKVAGYAFSGKWFDITDPTEYEKALKGWKK